MTAKALYLVIGSGSIARRHMRNLRALYPDADVGCVSASGRALSADDVEPGVVRFLTLDEAMSASPVFAVVASPAPAHVAHARKLLETEIPVLIEKPLSDSMETLAPSLDELMRHRDKIEIAYNLRFMPSAVCLRQAVVDGSVGRVLSVSAEVGQYLPDWRPGSDYRKQVSAQNALGGGVLRELSHEIDYLVWIFGRPDSVFCIANRVSDLEIDVEDVVDAFLIHDNGPVINLHMDFLQRSVTRRCKVIGETGTLVWDMLKNTVVVQRSGGEETTLYSDAAYDRNAMYIDELVHFAKVASGASAPFVDIGQAADVLRLIDAMRQSAATHQQVAI
ncbi:Putative oxidoreductase YteT [Pandoraea aquatica]|uniref:Oxidoreductase YteT n=1 Tax=Pandoraea aquatica TaxID=2508290 RepID=A0A5E4YL77_9BURK|nr:Gfo/Idh/MocA family oxidoreductase [Pandoraea aquatica]VVE49524.1 Putative oxidoreductase YteT [Pandoraea aquatica]